MNLFVFCVAGVKFGGVLELCERVSTDPWGAGIYEGLPLREIPQGWAHSHDF